MNEIAEEWLNQRDEARAEAASLRYAMERIEDKTALAVSRQERIDAGIIHAIANNALLVNSPLATRAAAVLMAAGELLDVHEKFGRGEESYRAENKVMEAVGPYRAAMEGERKE